jgi:hypothetical protein
MILFQEDIYNQRAYIHADTTNLSFIKTSIILKRLGVENNKFPLVIYNKDLIKHDPHNLKDNSTELRLAIAEEAFNNPWYYFREVVRIPVQGGPPVKFLLNRANLALIWAFYNHIDTILVIPRQTGKTMSTQGIFSQIVYISGRNLNIAMLTKSNKLVLENVVRLKDIRDGLPEYLVYKQPKDTDNKEGISYELNKTRYLTFVAQQDKSGADNLGRGMTVPVMHWDEAGMFPNIDISYPVAINATIAAVESAKNNNQPHSNIITTTAGKLDTREGRFTHGLITNALTFTEKIYDSKNKEELLDILNMGSTNKMMYLVYSYLQLGYTHEWFKDRAARSGGTQDDIDRDFLNIWKLGGLSGVLSQNLLKLAKETQRDPLFTEIDGNYIIKWYIDKRFIDNGSYDKVPIILGMDPSENIGRDFTSFVAIDSRNMEVLFTCRCNESNIIKVALFVVKLLLRFTSMLFIPERNSTGSTIVDMVILELQKKGINPFRRIFNLVVQHKYDEDKFKRIDINNNIADGTIRKYFGFRTTAGSKSRDYLYSIVLLKAMQLNATKLYDNILIEELTGLIIKNGRVDHQPGSHDDTVIAYLLACYVLFAGKNLNIYGIESKVLLSQLSEDHSKESAYKDTQDHIRDTIGKLQVKINTVNNEILRASYIRKLNELKSQLDDKYEDNTEAISQDQVIKKEDASVRAQQKIIYNENTVESILDTI